MIILCYVYYSSKKATEAKILAIASVIVYSLRDEICTFGNRDYDDCMRKLHTFYATGIFHPLLYFVNKWIEEQIKEKPYYEEKNTV